MIGTNDFALARPELADSFRRGEALLSRAMERNLRVVRAHETLFSAGEPHDLLYRLRTGWLVRRRILPDNRRQIIGVFLPGDFFCIKAIFMTHQPDGIEALSDAGIEWLDHRAALALSRENWDVGMRLWWQVAEEERRLHTWVVGLGRADAEERIAAMIVDFEHRLGRAGFDTRQGFRLPMTQQQLADYLGLTVVHVNRVLRRFREAGVFVVQSGRVSIQNMAALREAAFPVLDFFDREVQPEPGEDATT